MTNDHPDHRDLQQQLDDAGRLWRPRHPGWDTLLDRLPQQERSQQEVSAGLAPVVKPAGERWQIAWRWVVVAASLLLAATVGILLLIGPDRSLQAQMLPIEVLRRGIQVTIFNASRNTEPTLFTPLHRGLGSATGQPQEPEGSAGSGLMLVKDRRQVLHLQRGDNVVRFTDVAATIDPTSVRLVSDTDPLGTTVVEQNFEFDLASADGILARSVNQKVACIGKSQQDLVEGYLLSFDQDQLVLSDARPTDDTDRPRPQIQTIRREQLQIIRVAEIPAGLQTRPTLVWTLRTDKPGDHDTTLTYLCGNAVWRADYVAVLSDSDSPEPRLDLKGWVTVDNRSGATYEDAGLKLIAGDVNRVRDPWAEVPRKKGSGRIYAGTRLFVENFEEDFEHFQFMQKDFFEYKLYTLSQPSTIKDRQIKQLQLLKATDVMARRRYLCAATPGSGWHSEVRLQIENRENNDLGMPLPKGTMTVMAADADGEFQFVNRYEIDHTAKDEKVNISMGTAFDVIYDYRVVDTQRPADRHLIETYEFVVRNHKQQVADVRLVGRLADYAQATVLQSSDEFTQHDLRTLHFDFVLEPNSEKRVTYRVSYIW